MALTVRVADGAFGAIVTGEGSEARPKSASAKPAKSTHQTDLFS
jgi:hypothetical protein